MDGITEGTFHKNLCLSACLSIPITGNTAENGIFARVRNGGEDGEGTGGAGGVGRWSRRRRWRKQGGGGAEKGIRGKGVESQAGHEAKGGAVGYRFV